MEEFVVERKTFFERYIIRDATDGLYRITRFVRRLLFFRSICEESCLRVRKSNRIYRRAIVARKLLTHCSANSLTLLKEYIRRDDAHGTARDSIFFSRSQDVTMRSNTSQK